MAVTIFASRLIASTQEKRRDVGFWVFLVSNAAWAVWGWHTQAWALISLQFALAAMNVRGAMKTTANHDRALRMMRRRATIYEANA